MKGMKMNDWCLCLQIWFERFNNSSYGYHKGEKTMEKNHGISNVVRQFEYISSKIGYVLNIGV